LTCAERVAWRAAGCHPADTGAGNPKQLVHRLRECLKTSALPDAPGALAHVRASAGLALHGRLRHSAALANASDSGRGVLFA
jgi:hypothetical protein